MSVFQNLKVYIVPRTIDDARADLVRTFLGENGARLSSYLTDSISILIADHSDSSEVGEARDIYDIPVVSSCWVLASVRCGFALPHGNVGQLFSPEVRHLFVDLVFCPSQVAKHDANLLWAVAVSLGADCQRVLTTRTTHLICASINSAKYSAAASKGGIRIVVPQWVMDCARSGELLDEAKYHPRLFVDEPSDSSLVDERDTNAAEAIQNLVNTLKLEAQQLDEHHQQTKQAYHQQHLMYGAAAYAPPPTPVAPQMAEPSSPLGPLEPNRFREMVEKQHVAVMAHQQYHAMASQSQKDAYPTTASPSTYTAAQHTDVSPGMSPQQRIWYAQQQQQQQNAQRPFAAHGHLMPVPSPTMVHPASSSYAQQHASQMACIPTSSEGQAVEAQLVSPKMENSPAGSPAQVYMQQMEYYGHRRSTEMYPAQVGYQPQQQQMYSQAPLEAHQMRQQYAPPPTVSQGYPGSMGPRQQMHPRMMVSQPQSGPYEGGYINANQMQQQQQQPPPPPRRMMINQNAGVQPHQMMQLQQQPMPRMERAAGSVGYAPVRSTQISRPVEAVQQVPVTTGPQPSYGSPTVRQQQIQRTPFPPSPAGYMPPPGTRPAAPMYPPGGPAYPMQQQQQQQQYAQSSGGQCFAVPHGQRYAPPRTPQQQMRMMAYKQPQAARIPTVVEGQRPTFVRMGSGTVAAQQVAPRLEEPRKAAPNQQSTDCAAKALPVQYVGHDPRLNVPGELCLIGCVFVIVDYERTLDQREVSDWRTVIEQHGGEVEQAYSQRCTHIICESLRNPVVQQALKEDRRCVTAQWLDDCMACRRLLPPWKAVHFPSGYGDNKPCKGRVFSVSGFTAIERSYLKQMITSIGARYTSYFSRLNHLLIAKTLAGRKVTKATLWKVPVVNLQWLTEVFFGQTAAVQNMTNQKYRRFFPKEIEQEVNFDPFRIDAAAIVPVLMNAWRVPIGFNTQTWKTAATKRYSIEHDDGSYFPYKKIKLSPAPTSDDEPAAEEKNQAAAIRVCFTGFYPTEVANLAQKVLWLGAKVVQTVGNCTHLVTVDLKRTRKLLEAIAMGKYVVTAQWIRQSVEQRAFVDPLQFLAKDEGNETFFGFNLKLSLFRARQRLLFDNILFYVTPSVQPMPSVLSEIVHTAGGVVLRKWPSCGELMQYKKDGTPFVIIACENDLHLCQTMLQAGIDLYSAEFVLTGILRQEVDMQSYKLEQRPLDVSKPSKAVADMS